MSSLKNWIFNLNLFQPPPDSEQIETIEERYLNVIATRIYLLVITLSLVWIGIYSWLSPRLIIVTVNTPNIDAFNDLLATGQCPCSRISVKYGEFTSIEPIFHQVCSSDFVSDRWVKTIYTGSNSTQFYLKDFRKFGSAQFQGLSGLCYLSKLSIDQTISLFNQNIFVSSQALRQVEFSLQIKSAIDQFKRTAPNTFKNQLDLIRRITSANKLVSGLQTNYIIYYYGGPSGIDSVVYEKNDGTLCDCVLDANCVSNAVFDDTFGASSPYISNNMTTIKGIAAGCLPLDSILSSTLECFYNQTCLNNIISFFPTNETFSALSFTNRTFFSRNATIQSIIDVLMIEEWIVDISYNKYYNQCAPSLCTYPEIERHDFLFVLTKLIGLLSGLTLVLSFIVPAIVRFLLKKRNKQKPVEVTKPTISLKQRFQMIKLRVKKILNELNIFKKDFSTDQQIQYQRYATRLYIFFIVTSLTILSGVKLIKTAIVHQTINDPSESKYVSLEKSNLVDLSCPCQSIVIPYSEFVSIQVKYHQLCSSYLISSQWISYSSSKFIEAPHILDYRINSANQFQILSILCAQAKKMIDDSLNLFLKTEMISSKVISQDLFRSEMNSKIENWKINTINQFVRSLKLIRVTTLTNQLMNRLNIFFQSASDGTKVMIEPRVYGECNCAFFGTCRTLMKMFSDTTEDYVIPNFYIGCYLFDSLLLSTLECFYDKSCMNELEQYLDSSIVASLEYPALDSTFNSPSETIESIVNQMMVDTWSWNISFSSYYKICSPNSCSIEYSSRDDLFTVVTSVLSIFGGLSIGFKLLHLLGLQIIEFLKEKNSLTVLIQSMKTLCTFNNSQQMTDRLHIMLVITTLTTLYLLRFLIPQLTHVQIQKPSLRTYVDLSREHADSLYCSCSKISVQYESFVNINSSFHPACAKDFIGEFWAMSITNFQNVYRNISRLYTYSAAGQLQALTSLCQLSRDTVDDSVSQFLKSSFVNAQLLSSGSLSQRVQTALSVMKLTMPKVFLNTFSLLRELTKANKYMTTFSATWIFPVAPNLSDGDACDIIPQTYEQCDCGFSSKCSRVVDGVGIGCYILETLLKSTLECLYDQQCVDRTNTFSALNISINPSRFPINSTFESVFNELMIEELSHFISYEKYYSQCDPTSCSYSYIAKTNVVEGITMIISLYGGLMIICKAVAHVIVNLTKSAKIFVINR